MSARSFVHTHTYTHTLARALSLALACHANIKNRIPSLYFELALFELSNFYSGVHIQLIVSGGGGGGGVYETIGCSHARSLWE